MEFDRLMADPTLGGPLDACETLGGGDPDETLNESTLSTGEKVGGAIVDVSLSGMVLGGSKALKFLYAK